MTVSRPAPHGGAEPLAEGRAAGERPIIAEPPGQGPKKTPKLAAIASNFSPKKVFWDRPRENIQAFREAKSIKDTDLASDGALVKAKVEVKFLGALALSEVAGTCIGAPTLGVAFQELFHSSYMGVVGTIVGDYLPAVVGFQAAWAVMNAGFYASRAGSVLGRIKEFYHDVTPIHLAAAAASVPAYAAGAALSSGLIALMNRIGEHLSEKIKIMPLVSEVINFGVVEGIYLSLLAGSTVVFVDRIVKRYSAYLEHRFGKAGETSAGAKEASA
jgi:hypothetical protein